MRQNTRLGSRLSIRIKNNNWAKRCARAKTEAGCLASGVSVSNVCVGTLESDACADPVGGNGRGIPQIARSHLLVLGLSWTCLLTLDPLRWDALPLADDADEGHLFIPRD